MNPEVAVVVARYSRLVKVPVVRWFPWVKRWEMTWWIVER